MKEHSRSILLDLDGSQPTKNTTELKRYGTKSDQVRKHHRREKKKKKKFNQQPT